MEYEENIVLRCPVTHQILRPRFTGDRLEPKEDEEKPAPAIEADLSVTE